MNSGWESWRRSHRESGIGKTSRRKHILMAFHRNVVGFFLQGGGEEKGGSRKRKVYKERNNNMKGYDLFPFCLGEEIGTRGGGVVKNAIWFKHFFSSVFMKVLSSQPHTLAFSQVALWETIHTTRLHRNLLAQGKAQVIAGNLTANFPTGPVTVFQTMLPQSQHETDSGRWLTKCIHLCSPKTGQCRSQISS